jgi:hypothetical protein
MGEKHLAGFARIVWLGRWLLGALAAVPASRTEAATLSQEDVSLALFASPDGSAWSAVGSGLLAGYFGPHRCLCPYTLMATVVLTSAGQAKLGTSAVGVSFVLGSNCLTAAAGCSTIGQVTFSSTQTATAPTFSSSLVYQAVAGSQTVACSSLKVGSTTLWAVLAQDGVALPFAATLDLPVITKTVAAPTAVTAQPANQGLLVSWRAPTDSSLVTGYQVLCLPKPTTAAAAGYESCGIASSADPSGLSPADATQLCSAVIPAGSTSIRVDGLANGVTYTVGVVAIDVSGGVSAVSPTAQATPQATTGFYEKYKQDGGVATGCSLLPAAARPGRFLATALVALALWLRGLRRRWLGVLLVVLALGGTARGQEPALENGDERPAEPPAPLAEPASAPGVDDRPAEAPAPRAASPAELRRDDWPAESLAPRESPSSDWAREDAARGSSRSGPGAPPDWGFEVGISLYRPAVDSEFGGRAHPFADTFSNSRHLLSEAELVRYLGHGFGSWGVGLRAGYYKVTAAAFLADGTRSGDETGLRLIPCALSLIYRAVGLPGLRRVPLIPYAKLGLDGVLWTMSNTGDNNAPTGFTLGWHAAGGMMLGLGFLNYGEGNPHGIADPCALFFEWSYAAINGLGMGHALHVGDSTWFAGVMFDI